MGQLQRIPEEHPCAVLIQGKGAMHERAIHLEQATK
jgi:hypothetical protein